MRYLILVISLNLHAIPHQHEVSSFKESPKHNYKLSGLCYDFKYLYGETKISKELKNFYITKAVAYCFRQSNSYCLKGLYRDTIGNVVPLCGTL